jgi:hypothetical protein
MNLAFAALLASLVTTQTAGPPKTDAEGRAYFEKLYRNRAAITCGYLEYQVTKETYPRSPDLEGSVVTYKLWFDKDRRRLDVSEVRPKDPASALATRYSYSDGVHRAIEIDESDVSVLEYSSDYLKGANPPAVMVLTGHLIDPRLLGIIGMEYGFLQHKQLDKFKAPQPNTTVHVRQLSATESEVILTYPNGSEEIYYLRGASLLPFRIIAKFAPKFPDGRPAPDRRVEVESEVVAIRDARGESFDFPRTLKIRRIKDGELEDSETITVLKADFNVPVDPKDMTWKALNPKVGVGITIDDDGKWSAHNALEWDGEKFMLKEFEVASTSPNTSVTPAPSRGSWLRPASWVMASLGVVLAGVFAVAKISGRQ